MDEVFAISCPVPFKVYGRALGWGYPMGAGYRYLSLARSVLLLRLAALPEATDRLYLQRGLRGPA